MSSRVKSRADRRLRGSLRFAELGPRETAACRYIRSHDPENETWMIRVCRSRPRAVRHESPHQLPRRRAASSPMQISTQRLVLVRNAVVDQRSGTNGVDAYKRVAAIILSNANDLKAVSVEIRSASTVSSDSAYLRSAPLCVISGAFSSSSNADRPCIAKPPAGRDRDKNAGFLAARIARDFHPGSRREN